MFYLAYIQVTVTGVGRFTRGVFLTFLFGRVDPERAGGTSMFLARCLKTAPGKLWCLWRREGSLFFFSASVFFTLDQVYKVHRSSLASEFGCCLTTSYNHVLKMAVFINYGHHPLLNCCCCLVAEKSFFSGTMFRNEYMKFMKSL